MARARGYHMRAVVPNKVPLEKKPLLKIAGAELDVLSDELCPAPGLEPHPTDPRRVFRTANCYAGRNLSDALRQSLDAGATWADLFEPQLAFPSRLAGGAGAAGGAAGQTELQRFVRRRRQDAYRLRRRGTGRRLRVDRLG